MAPEWLEVDKEEYTKIDGPGGTVLCTGGYPGGFSKEVLFGTIEFSVAHDGAGAVGLTGSNIVFNRFGENGLIESRAATFTTKKSDVEFGASEIQKVQQTTDLLPEGDVRRVLDQVLAPSFKNLPKAALLGSVVWTIAKGIFAAALVVFVAFRIRYYMARAAKRRNKGA